MCEVAELSTGSANCPQPQPGGDRQGRPPHPGAPVEVWTPSGLFVGRVDLAWPGYRTVGGFDGRVKYRRYLRPGQDPGDAVYPATRLRRAFDFAHLRRTSHRSVRLRIRTTVCEVAPSIARWRRPGQPARAVSPRASAGGSRPSRPVGSAGRDGWCLREVSYL